MIGSTLLLATAFGQGVIGAEAVPEPAAPAAPVPMILADLPRDVVRELGDSGARLEEIGVQGLLDAVLSVSSPYEFVAGPLVARTDVRWFSTLPADTPGAPLLELRRWPGDSVLALYSLRSGESPSVPDWPGAVWGVLEGTGPGVGVWDGTVETPAGRRPAMWTIRRVAEGQPWLGALLLPGDAGLGTEGTQSITAEMLGILRRLEIRPAAWKAHAGIPTDVTPTIPITVEVPGEASELDAPWQVARAEGFTVGLPPGIRARQMGGDVPAPQPLEGGLLWLRGRFVDSSGEAVQIGDAARFGYVARVAVDSGEDNVPRPPLGATQATRLAAEPFPLAAARTGAARASAERWSEPGFAGQWLLFRLQFAERAFEIGLPVAEGRQSPSLFWIPATWRDDTKPPAPPPVDPAERFGIRFERLSRTDRLKQPWVEGYLKAPGLTVEVSRGWLPAASLRSDNGYPIRFITEQGITVGILMRLSAGEVQSTIAGIEGLVEVEKPGHYRATRVLHDADQDYLFVGPAPGHAFVFQFVPPDGSDAKQVEQWRELWSLLVASVRLKD